MFRLEGKAAFIAGGAGYLGIPVCRGFLDQGAEITIADFNRQRLEEAAESLSTDYPEERFLTLHFDIGDESSINRAIDSALDRYGRLDVMINSTFGSTAKSLEELSSEEFERVNRINLTGSFLLARKAARAMKDGGSIIMYASMYGLIAPNPGDYPGRMNPNPIEYGAGKAGLMQMVRYLAAHYGPKNIRVNAIAPGAFPNESTRTENPVFMKNLSAKSMLGRIGKQDETAGAAVFLASDEAAFITGHVLAVDGGVTAW